MLDIETPNMEGFQSGLVAMIKMFNLGAQKVPNLPIQDSLRYLKLVRDVTDAIAATEKDMRRILDALRQQTIPQLYKDNGITSLSVDGYRFTLSTMIRANIKEGMKEPALEWLRENDLGDLIIETVNASTLSSQARALIEEGKELDPDLFNTAHMQTTSITKV